VVRELANHLEDTDPPWIDYGKRLRADYVIVSHLLSWQVTKPGTIGYAPAWATMDLQIYSVASGKLVYKTEFDASVGTDPESATIYHDPDKARRALIREILTKWRSVFVGKGDVS
jgi:hypothetical protein